MTDKESENWARECFVRKHAPTLLAGLWANPSRTALPRHIIESLEELYDALKERYE